MPSPLLRGALAGLSLFPPALALAQPDASSFPSCLAGLQKKAQAQGISADSYERFTSGLQADLSVLDLSAAALHAAQARLGDAAAGVTWIEADITTVELPPRRFDLWHDRAVFHFLTDPAQRDAYVATVLRAVKPGGHVIVAAFAEDGPERCSGLPVMRYGANALHAQFGARFELLEHSREAHHTPTGVVQQFVYCFCRRSTS